MAQDEVDPSTPVQSSGTGATQQQEGGDAHGGGVEAQEEGDCNPNYEGECLDQAGDYDCPDGEGNGPNFTEGEVEVVGEDEYDLDNEDDDNIGCNDQDGENDSDDGATPSGGVDSGLGGTATQSKAETPSDSSFLALSAGGALMALAASGALFLVRRKRAQD